MSITNRLFFSVTLSLLISPLMSPFEFDRQALAHGGSHDAVTGVFKVVESTRIPKGLSLQVVKTNAEQFALATDGSLKVEVLDPTGRAFIRFSGQKVEADLNSQAWFRAQMPGGGKVPDRITASLPPKWTRINVDQPGLGWYDKRLLDEDSNEFKLKLKINGQTTSLNIKRMPLEQPAGQWVHQIKASPTLDGFTVLLPQPRSAALMVQFTPALNDQATTAEASNHAQRVADLELLDDQGKPYIRFNGQTIQYLQTHPWANSTKLNPVNSPTPTQVAQQVDHSEWSTTSLNGRLVYQEPRLLQNQTPKAGKAVQRTQQIPVRDLRTGQTHLLVIQSDWQANAH